ncbi:MAG: FGGY-family carbohydrate kinase [Spirochaetia bacterium]|nr:FGGY-family carbohydrate kinase [Spirochaetia bacterium]
MESFITIDIGTTNFKSMLYKADGTLLFTSVRNYQPVFLGNQQVRQDPDTWKSALYETLTDTASWLKENNIIPAAAVVASQRASVIPVDGSGVPLYDAFMWQDKTTLAQCENLRADIDLYSAYRKTGLRIDPYFSAPKILWLRDNEPQVYKKTAKFLGVQDYAVFLLTGNFITDHTQASRTLLFDIEKRIWSDDMLNAAGIHQTTLPDLIPPGEKAGILLKEVSQITGLPEALPVVIAGGDQQAAAVGLGVFKNGRAEANTGTGSFIITHSDAPVFDREMRILCSISAAPDGWVAEAGILTSGIIYKWLSGMIGGVKQAGDTEKTDIEEINHLAGLSSPGAGGVIILPHFKGCAAPYWDPYAKGVIFNLSLATTKGDIARAALESIALELSDNVSIIEENTGKIDEITVAGGLTQLDLFNRIQSDAFDRPVLRYGNPEATSIGSLIIGGRAVGIFSSIEEGFGKIVQGNPEVYSPDKANAEIYKNYSIFRKKLYASLSESSLFKDVYEYQKEAENAKKINAKE